MVNDMHITISLDPVIFEVGMFQLRWYSLAIMVAIAVAAWFTAREFRRKGLDTSRYDSLVIWAVVSGIIGARLFHIIDRLGYYLDNPARMLHFMSGGLAIYGAVIGGFVGIVIATRIYKMLLLPVIDAIAPGLVLAQAIGRFGCIVNGDAWGARTDWPFAFVYTNPDAYIPNQLLNVPTHPYPLYDMALNLGIFGLLLWLRKKELPKGALFATFIAIYGFGRFFISFVREERIWFWGLQEAQILALAGVVTGALWLGYLWWQREKDREQLQLETV